MRLKLKPELDVDDSERTSSSSPVERFHRECHPSGGSFGFAEPTTFSVLDEKHKQMTPQIRQEI